jgi:formylglycine-generating enzyme required for sulfatase activity
MKRCRLRVVRGGSWYYIPRDALVTNRSRCTPDYRGSNLGFRLVRSER